VGNPDYSPKVNLEPRLSTPEIGLQKASGHLSTKASISRVSPLTANSGEFQQYLKIREGISNELREHRLAADPTIRGIFARGDMFHWSVKGASESPLTQQELRQFKAKKHHTYADQEIALKKTTAQYQVLAYCIKEASKMEGGVTPQNLEKARDKLRDEVLSTVGVDIFDIQGRFKAVEGLFDNRNIWARVERVLAQAEVPSQGQGTIEQNLQTLAETKKVVWKGLNLSTELNRVSQPQQPLDSGGSADIFSTNPFETNRPANDPLRSFPWLNQRSQTTSATFSTEQSQPSGQYQQGIASGTEARAIPNQSSNFDSLFRTNLGDRTGTSLLSPARGNQFSLLNTTSRFEINLTPEERQRLALTTFSVRDYLLGKYNPENRLFSGVGDSLKSFGDTLQKSEAKN